MQYILTFARPSVKKHGNPGRHGNLLRTVARTYLFVRIFIRLIFFQSTHQLCKHNQTQSSQAVRLQDHAKHCNDSLQSKVLLNQQFLAVSSPSPCGMTMPSHFSSCQKHWSWCSLLWQPAASSFKHSSLHCWRVKRPSTGSLPFMILAPWPL